MHNSFHGMHVFAFDKFSRILFCKKTGHYLRLITWLATWVREEEIWIREEAFVNTQIKDDGDLSQKQRMKSSIVAAQRQRKEGQKEK